MLVKLTPDFEATSLNASLNGIRNKQKNKYFILFCLLRSLRECRMISGKNTFLLYPYDLEDNFLIYYHANCICILNNHVICLRLLKENHIFMENFI